jgi:protein-tyrosine phosphatase
MDQDFSTAPPQRLLAAVPNFRDIGGLRGAGGCVVRSGMVYRSGALDALLDEDLARLAGYGVAFCCDLRTAAERTRSPSRWPEGRPPRLLELEFASDVRALGPELMHRLAAQPSREAAAAIMLGLYRSMPATCAPLLARLLPELANAADAFPLVVHCTAGKDRTGFVVAVLLGVLGVSPADIRVDYLHSNHSSEHLRLNPRCSSCCANCSASRPTRWR